MGATLIVFSVYSEHYSGCLRVLCKDHRIITGSNIQCTFNPSLPAELRDQAHRLLLHVKHVNKGYDNRHWALDELRREVLSQAGANNDDYRGEWWCRSIVDDTDNYLQTESIQSCLPWLWGEQGQNIHRSPVFGWACFEGKAALFIFQPQTFRDRAVFLLCSPEPTARELINKLETMPIAKLWQRIQFTGICPKESTRPLLR
jgi:hypothetical protein